MQQSRAMMAASNAGYASAPPWLLDREMQQQKA